MGKPVIYHRGYAEYVASVGAAALRAAAVWILLALVVYLLLMKANCNWRAWAVLIPLAVIGLGGFAIGYWWEEELVPLVYAFGLSLTVFWLLSHWRRGRRRLVSFFFALMVTLPIGCLITWASSDFGWYLCVFFLLSMSAVVLAFTLAGFLCRRRFGPWRFSLWLLVVGLLCNLFAIAAFYAGVCVFIEEAREEILEETGKLCFYALLTAAISWGVVYALLLPFLILTFRNRLYRARFFALLHLKSMAPAEGEPTWNEDAVGRPWPIRGKLVKAYLAIVAIGLLVIALQWVERTRPPAPETSDATAAEVESTSP